MSTRPGNGGPSPKPRRRSMDRDRWPDDRLDDFSRLVGPVVGIVAQHAGEIDALKDLLLRQERDNRERHESVVGKLNEIGLTVQGLERARIADEAVRAARAEALEEGRKTLALKIATWGWVRPTIAGGVVAGLVTAILKLTGLA